MARRTSSVGWVRKDDRLFTLEVFITGGPMTAKFVRTNKVVCRTIKIRGRRCVPASELGRLVESATPDNKARP